MDTRIPSDVRAFERWMSASVEEAETLVPDLLALPGPMLRRELRRRPELRTAGVMKRLLAVARDALDRFPSRALEITTVVARYTRSMHVPAEFPFASRIAQGEAWREHANALRESGRPEKAQQAIRLARTCFEGVPGSSWLLATVDLIEAPLLHDRGSHDGALRMIRGAAESFRRGRNHGPYLEARMIESWMLWVGGDHAGAAQVWNAMAESAQRRGDLELGARIAAKMGVLELRDGSAEEAFRLFESALQLFDAAGGAPEEAVRARWGLAEALAARGRVHEAISEFHKVCAELLGRGSLGQAAMAAVEVLDLHLVAGREEELPSLTAKFVSMFRDAGFLLNAMEALAYLRGRAGAEQLNHGDIALVRAFYEELTVRPYSRFRAP